MKTNDRGLHRRWGGAVWFAAAVAIALLAPICAARAALEPVRVVADAEGRRLEVGGRPLMVLGMNWDYVPIGENYAYDFWAQPDDFIEVALDREMGLLRNMGANAIRVYAGIPPRWVRHIYERYGIWTIINHPMARYGFTLDGAWIPAVDYSDPRIRAAVTAEVVTLVEEFRGVPGVLLWLLGNENNYGLTWSSFEIEALPEGERNTVRARYLYSLFGEVIDAIHERDLDRPVAIANGDLQYVDLIAEECPNLDILGSNVYRGISARDFFQVVEEKLRVPALFTEFGADAWNAREMREDEATQAKYLLGQWQEIYEQSSGKGRVGNAIGGCTFQWSDGWWKYRQEERLDLHDTNASWPNGGYAEDFVAGDNNMNEEWWGVCAKGPTDASGHFELYPRAAYYALQRAYQLDPYDPGTTLEAIRSHFGAIHPVATELAARGDQASRVVDALSRVRLSGLRLDLETFSTGGARVSTPESEAPSEGSPSFRGFDHLQSYYADLVAEPRANVQARLSLNLLGNVPQNPIDEIFYENRGRANPVRIDGQEVDLAGLERLRVYQAAFSWDDRWFQLDGFYRTGHLHWQYEGDFFGLYRDAYYGENIDVYDGRAPLGVEIDGKRVLAGLTVAYGPELWWGANPSIYCKYRRGIGPVTATVMYADEFAEQSTVTSSIAVPRPPTRTATLVLETRRGPFALQLGGIWGGETKIGEVFQVAEPDDSGNEVQQDRVRSSDTFGAKAKLIYQQGRWNAYAQTAYMGIVADGGPTAIPTFTGWTLEDTGSGNQSNIIGGFAVNLGRFQIGPNVLYQKPLVGPIPGDVAAPGRPRNVLDDPFAVRANRETFGAELLLAYDPTPATWMWAWDNDAREDAALAASLGLVYRDLRTTQDAAIGLLADGTTTFAFPGATPPRELWEVRSRILARPGRGTRLVAQVYAGTGEPNGSDARLIHYYGASARLTGRSLAFHARVKIDEWGPYDYHRDFNLTYPVQLMGDLSHTLGVPVWFDLPQTRIGVRGTWRSLDLYSPRYCPAVTTDGTGVILCNPNAPGDDGREWEVRTYFHIGI